MSRTLSFQEAIKASNAGLRAVLLGNGFSIAQGGGQFAYPSLLEQSGLSNDNPIRKVFDVIKTVDFERVMKALEEAAQIELAYGAEDRSERFSADAASVREALIRAIHTVHPGVRFEIPMPQQDACAAFLKNFDYVFTLSYDLLLYWVILHAARDRFSDGFAYGDEVDGFRTFQVGAPCNTYYLHGALHLFVDPALDTQKRILTSTTIIEDIAATIRKRAQLPLFVAEGTAVQKIARIRSIPYLTYCHDALISLGGNLFLFGHAASENDAHIYDGICQSKIKKIFVCVHEPDVNLAGLGERLAKYEKRRKDIEWHYVDATTARVWG
jgi:hypothetical protein